MLHKLFPYLWIFILTFNVKTTVMQHLETIKKQCIKEQTMLVLVHDTDHTLQEMSDMISHKMQAEVYDIAHDQIPDASRYDIVILGDVSEDGHLSQEMRKFLGWYDLAGNTVSSYWIGTQEPYESELKQSLRNADFVSGLGNDEKETENNDELNALMNGWLTSICSAEKNK